MRFAWWEVCLAALIGWLLGLHSASRQLVDGAEADIRAWAGR